MIKQNNSLVPLALTLIVVSHLILLKVLFLEAVKLDCYPIDNATKEKCEALGCVWSPVKFDNNDIEQDNGSKQTQTQHQSLGFNYEDSAVAKITAGVGNFSDVRESWCYMPENYEGYQVVDTSINGIKLRRIKPSALGNDIKEVKIEFEYLDDEGNMLRVKIYDLNKRRFEPELPKFNLKKAKVVNNNDKKKLIFKLSENGDSFTITRESTGAIIFSTDLTKLIFSDKFIQINSRLDSPYVYGLGEHYDTFLKKIEKNQYKTYSFFNTDKLPLPLGRRSYGGFPFYINLDSKDLKYAHGVYLHNSNAMDVVLQSDQSITFRPIGGILDFIFFIGPTPNDVIKQYQNLIGLPFLPPQWSLGFHLCRYNYKSLNKTKLVWQRTKDSGIPFDVQWNDVDYMNRKNDFSYDNINYNNLPEFVENSLHKNNMHYMILFDPGLSQENNYYPYELGLQMDIFIKNSTNQTLVGKVWNDSGRTVFPDFSNPLTIDYWSKLFVKFQKELKFDGAWNDMNDISNFVYGSLDGCPIDNYLERTPYRPGDYNLQTNSLCLSAKHFAGSEYNLHNLYSFYEAIATYKALLDSRPNKRPFIISRSTYPGQNHYGGHWSGDVLSNWDYLRWSIPSLIEFSMYGYSMMGSDICGFTGNTNQQLCSRWSTLGAFYTFVRNHNDELSIDQDPVALGPEVVSANKNALTHRYALLPYLYSLIHRANKFGEPAIRSVPFEFYSTDKEALNVEYQFLWGYGLMISPIVEENSYEKKTYLPKGRWYESNILLEGIDQFNSNYNSTYDFFNHLQNHVPKWIDSKGEYYTTKNISLSNMPLFYRGGNILPSYRIVEQTVFDTVKNQPIALRVFLCNYNLAKGELYLDDGDNIDGKHNYVRMEFEKNKLYIIQDKDDYKREIPFGFVNIYGISTNIKEVRVNDKKFSFTRKDHVLMVDLQQTKVSDDHPITVELIE